MFQINAKIFFIILFFIHGLNAQNKERMKATFGKPTPEELALKTYDKDLSASGVVLFEQGKFYTEMVDYSLRLIKEIHIKTKVLDASRFDQSTVFIPMTRNGYGSETISNFKAITHNGIMQTFVAADNTFLVENGYSRQLRFSFPNVKDGSVLEYTYRIISPFFFNLDGWYFQGNLPVVYSEMETSIPGNFVYKRELVGSQKLDIKKSELLRSCLKVKGFTKKADCDFSVYAMYNIPAFIEEKYMLSSKNYKSRIKYELKKSTGFSGSEYSYSRTWEDVDKEFETDKDIGGQLNYKGFFKGKLPKNIKLIEDDLERAKAVYDFIREHYIWNGSYHMFSNVRVKEAFSEKEANNTEINISLINALNAVDLDAHVMLMSTRENGLPSPSYPIITDFNYAVAALKIGQQHYLLDATDKNAPFGILPFRLLNLFGRVMDFKDGSYWQEITPNQKNLHYVNAQLQTEDNDVFSGTVQEIVTGYMAFQERSKIDSYTETEYLTEIEKTNESLTVTNGEITNRTHLEEPLKINYSVDLTNDVIDNKVYLNPYFFGTYFKENPFTLEERNYPIDFGFPITTTYLISIDLNQKYNVVSLPENKSIQLADGASCTVVYSETNGKIQMRYNFRLNSYYKAETYEFLKTFFEGVIKVQTQDLIVLEKN